MPPQVTCPPQVQNRDAHPSREPVPAVPRNIKEETEPEKITAGIQCAPDTSQVDTGPKQDSKIPARSSIPRKGIDHPRASIASSCARPEPLPVAPHRSAVATPSLTRKDLLILIEHYRGTTAGLESLLDKDLSILLDSYRVCVASRLFKEDLLTYRQNEQQKVSTARHQAEVRVKRERDNGEDVEVVGSRRKKRDVIVLGD